VIQRKKTSAAKTFLELGDCAWCFVSILLEWKPGCVHWGVNSPCTGLRVARDGFVTREVANPIL
jgi:hypothetical protein